VVFLLISFILTTEAAIFTRSSTMTVYRVSSLLMAEVAFANVSTPSETICKYSALDLNPASEDNEQIIIVAKNFLSSTCPQLLKVLESHSDQKSSNDRLIKIGRNINATLRYGKLKQIDKDITSACLDRLVKECFEMVNLLTTPVQVPKVRYGRTDIQMPIVTLGCMR